MASAQETEAISWADVLVTGERNELSSGRDWVMSSVTEPLPGGLVVSAPTTLTLTHYGQHRWWVTLEKLCPHRHCKQKHEIQAILPIHSSAQVWRYSCHGRAPSVIYNMHMQSSPCLPWLICLGGNRHTTVQSTVLRPWPVLKVAPCSHRGACMGKMLPRKKLGRLCLAVEMKGRVVKQPELPKYSLWRRNLLTLASCSLIFMLK